MDKTIEEIELENRIIQLRNELYNIKSNREAEENKKLIGKCFVYINKYSDDSSWSLYAMVESLNGSAITGWMFQHTSNNIIEITCDTDLNTIVRNGKEIDIDCFWSAYQQILRKLIDKQPPQLIRELCNVT